MSYLQSIRNAFWELFARKPLHKSTSFHKEMMQTRPSLRHSRIDDATYEDLHVLEVKERFFHPQSSSGDEVLDHWLRCTKGKNEISLIQQDLRKFGDGSREGKEIDVLLKRLGKQNLGFIVSDLWNGFGIRSRLIKISPLLILVSYATFIVLLMVLTEFLLYWLIIFLGINLATFVLVDRTSARLSGSINYCIAGIRFLDKLKKRRAGVLTPAFPSYRDLRKIKGFGIFFKDGFGGAGSEDIAALLIDYLRIFLGLQVIAFFFTNRIVQRNIASVREIVSFIGYYDVISCAARVISDNPSCYSKYSTDKAIGFTGLYHPLVQNPVVQTLDLPKGAVITGLNMAGKSTLMRAVGVNQLLATSFGFCFAKRYSTRDLAIVSSFRVPDRLLESKSRYFAEAERLASLIQKVKSRPSLVLIDEILTGTNCEERIYASVKVLSHLSEFEDSIVLSATHDLQIAEQLDGKYLQIYFDGRVEGDVISFDYLPKKGIVSKRNGLRILQALGIEV